MKTIRAAELRQRLDAAKCELCYRDPRRLYRSRRWQGTIYSLAEADDRNEFTVECYGETRQQVLAGLLAACEAMREARP